MVTAAQPVTGGKTHFQSSASSRIGGAAGGGASLAANAPPGTLKAKLEGSHEKSNGASNDFGHADERIWAAQFMPVSSELGPEEYVVLSAKKRLFLPKPIAQLPLQHVYDLHFKRIRSLNWENDGQRNGVIPNLIGRITVAYPEDGTLEDDEDEQEDSLVIDGAQYVANKKKTDWEQHGKYKREWREGGRDD